MEKTKVIKTTLESFFLRNWVFTFLIQNDSFKLMDSIQSIAFKFQKVIKGN